MVKFTTQYQTYERKIKTSDKPSLTDESFKDECDISLIIERFKIHKIPPRTVDIAYGYSPTVEDIQHAQMLLAETKTNFEGLPSKIRDEFGNNVENYLAYISDKANLRDCYERGLIDRSSVSIEMVYPERFQTQNLPSGDVQTPSVEPSVPSQKVETE